MTWRQRLLIALTAIVGLIVVVPATSGGRTWLLSQVALDLDRSGYTTSYRSSRGVAWGGVTLEDFTIRGNGVEIAAEQLKIRHFFPSLLIHKLTGEFPLALWADGLRGSVAASEALQGGGAGSPRLRLLASSLSRVDLAVDAIPFTIPDLELEDIRLEGVLEGFTFEAELSTAEGSAALRGSADLGARSLELEVIRADLTLARHWWSGAGTGTVTGHLSASPAGVRADFELLSGKADILGRRVTSISGPVRLDLPHIEADLSGQVFGGAVAARGGVDISGKNWSATFHSSPDLQQGADWLADLLDRPDLRGLPLEAEGRARVEVEGSDWREVSLKGEVSGHGRLAERGFDLLGASFSYSTGQSPIVEARATVAGGALEVSLRPEVDGFLLDISGQHIEPLPGLLVNAELSLQGGPDSQASGGGLLLMALADRVVAASIDTSVTPSGWQVSVEAADDRGARGDGVVVVQGPNLTGQLSVHDLRLPYLLEPVDLTVGAAGPLVALPVEITVGGTSVISAEWEGWRVHADPRGSVRAVIRRSGPSELAGRLGPLGFSSEIDFRSRTVRAEMDLEPVLLEGGAEVRAGLRQASLLWEAGRLDVTGTAQIQAGRIGGVTFGPVEARAQFGVSERLDQFELAGEFITARWEDTSIAVTMRGLPLVVADHTLSITGEVSADPDHLEQASFDLAANVAGISVGLAGQSPLLDLTISIP
ncbi:MAG: hypothetical protein OXC09_12070, partial [Truepera sp.]|nr:hypothetical protein [Truepera sp.]